MGITSAWIEPDAESSEKRLSGAKALRMQLEWASHMSLQACILPLPQLRGNAHLACILNQVCVTRHDALDLCTCSKQIFVLYLYSAIPA